MLFDAIKTAPAERARKRTRSEEGAIEKVQRGFSCTRQILTLWLFRRQYADRLGYDTGGPARTPGRNHGISGAGLINIKNDRPALP